LRCSIVVNFVGTVITGLVSLAVGQGIRVILRHELLQVSHGISLYWYEALVKAGQGSPQIRWRFSAVIVLFVVSCTQLLNVANTASFGTSIASADLK
jgi:hypothetical protein